MNGLLSPNKIPFQTMHHTLRVNPIYIFLSSQIGSSTVLLVDCSTDLDVQVEVGEEPQTAGKAKKVVQPVRTIYLLDFKILENKTLKN